MYVQGVQGVGGRWMVRAGRKPRMNFDSVVVGAEEEAGGLGGKDGENNEGEKKVWK